MFDSSAKDVPLCRSSVVAQLSNVLRKDTGIPDRVQTAASQKRPWGCRVTHLRRRPSKLKIAEGLLAKNMRPDVQLAVIATSHSPSQMQWLVHVSDKVNQESQRNILLGDTARGELEMTPRFLNVRLVRVHQDLGSIADGGDDVDFVVCPSVFSEHAVIAGDVVDGFAEGRLANVV